MVKRIEPINLFSVTRPDETIKDATHFNVFQKKKPRTQKKIGAFIVGVQGMICGMRMGSS
jgi:hypothetical protein